MASRSVRQGGRSGMAAAAALLTLLLTVSLGPRTALAVSAPLGGAGLTGLDVWDPSLVQRRASSFDDYADTTYTCPVLVTCPQICVGPDDACPTRCDPDLDQTLCADGVCRTTCPDDAAARNPCAVSLGDCAPRACPGIVQYEWACQDQYGSYYDAAAVCRDQQEAALRAATRYHPAALAAPLAWFLAVLAAVAWWGAEARRRQRNRTIDEGGDETTQLLADTAAAASSSSSSGADQPSHHPAATITGYETTRAGSLLHGAVLLTLVGIQALVCLFAVSSYGHNQAETLLYFEVTWSVGFLFTLAFKYPPSIDSVFYRECSLATAERVGIVTPPQPVAHSRRDPRYIRRLRAFSARAAAHFHAMMGHLFALPGGGGGGRVTYVQVRTEDGFGRYPGARFFVHEFRRYNYNSETQRFEPGYVPVAETLGDIRKAATGLTSLEVDRRLRVVGPNAVDMAEPAYRRCLLDEFSKPFYVYQLFMLWSWVPLYYFYLAAIHGSVIVAGGCAVALFRYRNERGLYQLTHVTGTVDCLRDNALAAIPQGDLVPGDVVQVAPGATYSDMVLVASEGLLVDESALTGESTPMAKTAIEPGDDAKRYDALLHKRHTIAAGTTVVESEVKSNLAVVLKTGSYTSKGELLREVFSYERHRFKFDVEVAYVLLLLFIEALVGFVLVTQFLHDQPVYSWFYGMYIIAAIIPPLLPTVFTVSVGISDNRLSRKRIACNNSQDILIAGKVTRALFDKTGTLTRQGLDFVTAHCLETWATKAPAISADLVSGMSCCHGLHQSVEGDLVGNPVDRTMFDASGAIWKEARGSSIMRVEDKNGTNIDVLKIFEFDHHRMTQSVIVKISDGSMMAFVKGSGESIKKLCREDTLPSDYKAEVNEAHRSGSYLISMAMKKLPDNTDLYAITRDQVECDLGFIGIINFKNIIRPTTHNVIRQLEAAEVRCIMVTGDNLLTGIRIAKEAGMIQPDSQVLHCSTISEKGQLIWNTDDDNAVILPSIPELQSRAAVYELAVTGDVWDSIKSEDPDYASELAQFIRVYGRCNPFQKVSVVNTFVEMGFITLMCGDGGNDCGALKTAHVGVALSDAEASIVSPFTSMDKEIESVVDILCEGRCALASALASYKYILMYGQLEGLANVIMAYFRINLTEYAWAFMDCFWVISMSFTLPLARAASQLSNTRPTASLLGPHTVASLCGVLFSNAFFVFLALGLLYGQDWMQCRKWNNEDVSNLMIIGDNYESETIFLVTGYQFLSTAMAYNFGYEFRSAWLKNYLLVACVCFFTAIHFYITLVPGKLSCIFRVNCDNEDVIYSVSLQGKVPIQNPYASTILPMEFRVTLIVIMVSNALANMGWDYFAVNGVRRYLGKKRRGQVDLIPAKTGGEVAETV